MMFARLALISSLVAPSVDAQQELSQRMLRKNKGGLANAGTPKHTAGPTTSIMSGNALMPGPRPGDSTKSPTAGTQQIVVDRCHDADDPPEWQEDPLATQSVCWCPNPWQPQPRIKESLWDAHHQRLVEYVQYAEERARQDGNPIELVLIGDSITERWNGTASMGRSSEPANRAVFEKYFGKGNNNRDHNIMDGNHSSTSHSSAPLHGIALGSSGDTTVETHWHIVNGMLPLADAARTTTVFLLLIGTNDLGRRGCSKRTTLEGILAVAQEIRRQQPHSPIVLHGLLPRTDKPKGTSPWTLNRHWQEILWINRELQEYAAAGRDQNWYYMEAEKIFLRNDGTDAHPVEIKVDLMPDGLHPNAAGLDLWGPRIVEQVQNIMNTKAQYRY